MRIIKLCLLKEHGTIDKSRLKIDEYEGKYYKTSICIGVLVEVTKSFDVKDKDKIEEIYDYWSYQIRPKALYENKNGIYYKLKNKRIFLTEEETKMVMDYMNSKKYTR